MRNVRGLGATSPSARIAAVQLKRLETLFQFRKQFGDPGVFLSTELLLEEVRDTYCNIEGGIAKPKRRPSKSRGRRRKE